MGPSTRFPSLLLVLVALAMTGYGVFKLYRFWEVAPVSPGNSPDREIHATVLPVASPLPAIDLVDHTGAPFTHENLASRWSYLFFGYTLCPDVCQPAVLVMSQLSELLSEQPKSRRPQVVFISIDPERDTPEVLKEYISRFEAPMIGVTGKLTHLKALTDPLGIFFQRSPEPFPDGYYKMDHTMSILLIDPEGRLRAISSSPHDAFVIAKDFTRIISLGG